MEKRSAKLNPARVGTACQEEATMQETQGPKEEKTKKHIACFISQYIRCWCMHTCMDMSCCCTNSHIASQHPYRRKQNWVGQQQRSCDAGHCARSCGAVAWWRAVRAGADETRCRPDLPTAPQPHSWTTVFLHQLSARTGAVRTVRV